LDSTSEYASLLVSSQEGSR